jgi:hypothetical protein
VSQGTAWEIVSWSEAERQLSVSIQREDFQAIEKHFESGLRRPLYVHCVLATCYHMQKEDCISSSLQPSSLVDTVVTTIIVV